MKLACSFTVVLALAMLPGCGPSISGLCEDRCDCTGDCSPDDEEDCVDNLEDAEREAASQGCEEQFDEALSCVDDEFACRSGAVDVDGCREQVDNLSGCADLATGLKFWAAFNLN
ncbi:hypothetical protein WMF27_12005 [Sorangium sp. So ce281]|uniref:hypothetical protein n=1 Tax=unclassified Sorangium TaxID=2621164 RepID=UPI003F60919B